MPPPLGPSPARPPSLTGFAALPLAFVGGFHEGVDLERFGSALTGGLPVRKNLTISTTSGR